MSLGYRTVYEYENGILVSKRKKGLAGSPSGSFLVQPSVRPVRRRERPTAIPIIITTYLTWNPEDVGDRIILSNGNLTATLGPGFIEGTARATIGVDSGKWYWEVTVGDLDYRDVFIGVGNSNAALDDMLGSDGTLNGWSYCGRGRFYNQAITSELPPDSYDTGDIIGIALDMDNEKLWFSKNGVWQYLDDDGDPDPEAGTGEAFSNLSGTIYPMVTPGYEEGDQVTANFGASVLVYDVPSGFYSGIRGVVT